MVKQYGALYLDTRRALLETEEPDMAGFMARSLICHVSGKNPDLFLADRDLYATEEVCRAVDAGLRRLKQGEPLAYVLGEWDFYGLNLTVSPDVLIPRDDTCAVTSLAIQQALFLNQDPRVLDLCCGSGCIACAVASELPATRVVAADISSAALEICRKNIKGNRLTSRIITMQADASTWPPMGIGSFDLILSNPPYIPSGDIIGLGHSVRDYEPLDALDGGEDGLDFYRAIIKYWTIILRPNGIIMFEVGEGQADAVKRMLLQAGYVSVDSRLDTLGVERVVIGKWKNEY